MRIAFVAGRRHTPGLVVRELRVAVRLLGEGASVADVARRLGVSEAMFHRWRDQYGGLKADDVERLKALGAENARLKRIVADKEPGDRCLAGDRPGKMVGPPRRRGAVGLLCGELGCRTAGV